MRKIVNKIYQNNTIIYKVLLFLITTVAIVYLFPKGGQFKYEFNNGKVWKYDNLYATFDFAIQKTEAEIIQEKEAISANSKYYFLKNTAVEQEVLDNFKKRFAPLLENDSITEAALMLYKSKGEKIIRKVYANGFLEMTSKGMIPEENMMVVLKDNNRVEDIAYKTFLTSNRVFLEIKKELEGNQNSYIKNTVLTILSEII
ncbi:phosphohydrolase, partial [Polaribacter sp.]|nr:phosphohydrolase [Polaribacter sp.]